MFKLLTSSGIIVNDSAGNLRNTKEVSDDISEVLKKNPSIFRQKSLEAKMNFYMELMDELTALELLNKIDTLVTYEEFKNGI